MNGIKPILALILVLQLVSTVFSGLNYFQGRQGASAATATPSADKLRISSYNSPLAQPPDAKPDAPVDVAQTPSGSVPDSSNDRLHPGDDAPVFTMQDISGNWMSLSQFKNKKHVIVMAWLQTCPHCLEFLPKFNKFVNQVKSNKKIQILTVTRALQPEDQDNLRAFLKKNKYTFPVLLSSDKDSQFGRDYKLHGIPTVWVVDSNLKIKGLFEGVQLQDDNLKSVLLKPLGM